MNLTYKQNGMIVRPVNTDLERMRDEVIIAWLETLTLPKQYQEQFREHSQHSAQDMNLELSGYGKRTLLPLQGSFILGHVLALGSDGFTGFR
jgi:hypothetical protein